jgi:hypothetical protein
MAKKKKSSNSNRIIKKGYSIGKADADDDDDFLFDCFVESPLLDEFEDIKSTRRIILGGTGSGKTAAIRWIDSRNEHARRVDPREFSIEYVSNSDVLQVLHKFGVELDLCFQILWQHLLVIEYIKENFDVVDEKGAANFLEQLYDFFRNDKAKQAALDYLKTWKGQFWETTDEIVREWTRDYEEKVKSVGGIDVHALKARSEIEGKEGNSVRVEIHERFKKVINPKLRADLSKVLDLLAEAKINHQKRIYLLIDHLDERWADDAIRFQMIGALIDTVKKLRKIPNLKVIISLRLDVLERASIARDDLGFQRDKLEDLAGRLRWSRADLSELADSRIQLLFKRQYTGAKVLFKDIFPAEGFDYIVERTLMRPRDVVSFVNQCLDHADGRSNITLSGMKEAERVYSRLRMGTLVDEWRSTFPNLDTLLGVISNRPRVLRYPELLQWPAWHDAALRIWSEEKQIDPIYPAAERVANNPSTISDFIAEALTVLYRVGAIGIKLQPGDRFLYSYLDTPVLSPTELSPAASVRVHLMLDRALNVRGADEGTGDVGEV